jgi:small conductance mechanosensitive channel
MEIEIKEPLQQVTGKLQEWANTFIEMLPNMLVALLLLILFFLIASGVKKVTRKVLHRTDSNKAIRDLLSTIVYYIVIAVGLFIILGVLGLQQAVVSLLAGVGVVGLALGFAFQDIAANFISGIILAVRNPFYLDDIIEVKDVMGQVVRTSLRATVVRTFQGQEVYIPNKDVLQSNITNFSALGTRRIDLPVGISYGDDLDKVEKVVKDAILEMEGVIRKEDLIFDFYEFGDSSINFNIRFWIDYPGQPGFLALRNEAVKRIKKAFDQHDITIPFPIRTLDFGIKGGETLSEMKVHTVNNKQQTNGKA